MMSCAEVLAIRERQPRSIDLNEKLNVPELQKSICGFTGHTQCVLSKIAEGGFHRIYTAELTGGSGKQEVIVRVAFDIPDFRNTRKMESEVATINWVKKHTNIPVPNILFYDPSGKASEPCVGAPYMIMEKIAGKTLERLWPTMNGRQRDDVVRLLAGYTAELLQTRFSAIGSLYPDGTDAQESTLGPMIPTCNPWCFRADATLDSGPWVTEIEYLVECIARELQWISSHQADLNSKWESENLGDRYKSLFTKLQKRIDTIECLNPGSGSFVLRHPDLDPANIMVVVDEDSEDDNSTVTVTSVLDWECANTAPIWAVAQIPEFLADRGEESGETVDERRSKAELRGLFSRSIPESFGVGSRKAQSLVALEEAAQTITTMRSVADLDRIVSDVFADLAAAGL